MLRQSQKNPKRTQRRQVAVSDLKYIITFINRFLRGLPALISLLLLVLLLVPAAGGQGPDDEEPAEFGAPARELPANARVEDIVEPSADYHYAGFGKADPFQVPVSIKAIVPDAVEIPIVSPLQRHSLATLKLVGVWARNSGERKALIMTPGMEGIIVKVGDLVGSGGGKVMSINDATVVVREFLIANDGTRQFSDVRLIFDDKPVAGVRNNAGGTIVIAPGATQSEVQLQNPGGPAQVGVQGLQPPQVPQPPPPNQVPSSINAAAPVGGAAQPVTPAAAAVTPPQTGQPAGGTGTKNNLPKQQGTSQNYNF